MVKRAKILGPPRCSVCKEPNPNGGMHYTCSTDKPNFIKPLMQVKGKCQI